tara:strand:- start:30 stop:209 length:180 start_codon:yes stop_codon:yes gene_type:complete
MGYREEELKAKGQKAMIEVDELKHKVRALENEVAILQEQLQKSYIRIKELNDQKDAMVR